MSNPNLDAALNYIKRGWHIFPLFYILKTGECSCKKIGCKRAGKHPITLNGCQDATLDEALVRQWWTESPHANIGLATGHDGLVVVDIDDAGAKVGSIMLRDLEAAHSPLPSTLVIRTGSGGRHFYFLSVQTISNSASKIAKDIDVRGTGGYVILPPSNHATGGHYEFLSDVKIADMPEWLENLAIGSKVDISKDELQKEVVEDAKKKETKLTKEQLIKLLDFIPSDCDRETWWQVGAALKKELGDENGFEAWDEWSSRAPDKYDSKVMRVQWNSFVDRGITGGSIFHFAKEHGFRTFDIEAADSAEIKDNWVYATSIKRFVETNTFVEWDKEQFDANFFPFFSKKPHEMVLRNENFKRIHGVTYWPEQPLYVHEEGQEKLNYWKPSEAVAVAGDTQTFIDHVKYLFPTEQESSEELSNEARILIQYMAFQVQHPGEKVHWALLLEGEQGNGKSYFGTVMRLVLGQSNVKMVHSDQLHEAFTAWQRNTQFIVVEEMMARGRLELMNKLKPMITESYCLIREMYRPPYEQPNRFNFMFFSNHPDSLILDSTDRRYCILKTLAPPHPERNAYYGPLFDWTRKNASALLYFLRHEVRLDGFQPKAHAPMTVGKQALIMQSMMPLDAFLFERAEMAEYPCQHDIISPSTLVKPLEEFNLRSNPKEIANSFKRLGFQQLGLFRTGVDAIGKISDTKINLWALRNFDTYKDMSAPQLRQIWLSQATEQNPNGNVETADAIFKNRPKNMVMDAKAM